MNVQRSSEVVTFLTERQSASMLPLDLVSPRLIGGGLENQCLENATRLSEREGYKVVSGWLYVSDPVVEGAQFTQHWWNYDEATSEYIDCSPSIEQHAVHIIDLEIAIYAARHKDLLTSSVCSSVMITPEGFFLVDYDDQGGYSLRRTTSLVLDVLFARYMHRMHVPGG